MIPAPVARAIVEVLNAAGGTLGTGFVVADQLVLTAKHVVADPLALATKHGVGGNARLRVRFCVDAAPVDADLAEPLPAAADWALLKVAAVPPAIRPLPLGTIGSIGGEVAWYSLGYARIRNGLRGGFHGVVRSVAAELELYCTELDGLTHHDARGLSGGPCIVDGVAIGLITDVLRSYDTGAVIAGQVHAIPLEQIRPASCALPDVGARPLPWELVFESLLEDLKTAALRIAASEARLANPVEGGKLPQQIARRMINQGVTVTAEVIRQLGAKLDRAACDQVMDAAETLWVDGTAADSLAAVVEAGVVGALATELDWSARHHLSRAYACNNLGAVPWTCVVVDADHDEPFSDAVLERAFVELAAAYGAGTDRAAVKRRVAAEPRATVFVVGAPRGDVIVRLRDEFPGLVIVFLSRARPSATAVPGVELIASPPTEADEASALTRNHDARARVRRQP